MILFSAGCLGGLANSLAVWLCGRAGLPQAVGVSIAPAWDPAWLYPRIVWGGLWGFAFLLPLKSSRPMFKGSWLSLLPSVVQLFVVFPLKTPHGVLGVGLGLLTPVFVLLYNWVWGIATAWSIRLAK
jgi:hypothetical protein